ncbi:hypothetical protein H2248_002356 [Termitomyces sp. 'cryptogamus']|nr:hypothetical protein H2248_002356 [Termitomyces sp. 'cryptogamus']
MDYVFCAQAVELFGQHDNPQLARDYQTVSDSLPRLGTGVTLERTETQDLEFLLEGFTSLRTLEDEDWLAAMTLLHSSSDTKESRVLRPKYARRKSGFMRIFERLKRPRALQNLYRLG